MIVYTLMPTIAWQAVSGAGSLALSGGSEVVVKTVLFEVDATVTGRTRWIGTTYPRGFRFGGIVGLLVDDATHLGVAVSVPVWWRHLEWEYTDWELTDQIVPSFAATHIFWRLNPGVTGNMKAYW